MDKLRIAHFLLGRCNAESANGLDKTVYHMTRAQAALGHDVRLFSVTEKEPLPIPGVRVVSFPPAGAGVARLLSARLRDVLINRSPLNLPRGLVAAALRWRPHILHLHAVYVPQNIVLAYRLRRAGIPYCVTINGLLSPVALRRNRWRKKVYNALFERKYLNRAAFLHAISVQDVTGIEAVGVQNAVEMAPNGIDLDSLPVPDATSSVAALFPSVAGKRVFLFVGRLDPHQKGLDLLLHGFAQLGRLDVALVIVGPDWRGHRATLGRLAEQLGIGEHVVFAGPAFGERKAALLASADVFVHPSRWEAGVPFSVLEAAAFGKPCLLTPAADPDGVLAKSGASVVAEPNADAIESALRSFADATPQRLTEMGGRARETVQAEFGWTPIAGTLIRAYRAHGAGARA